MNQPGPESNKPMASSTTVHVGHDSTDTDTGATSATSTTPSTNYASSHNTAAADPDTTASHSGSDATGDMPFCFRRGTDARAVTCRAKLQTKRCKLNQEINKELRLRAGAENLYKATINRKMKDTIALELSFVNSNLQLLKEKLSELNSSVEIYQHESLDSAMPMIPLGLKETKELNFMEPFADFILEHYSETPDGYADAIADIVDIRQAARTPSRDAHGLQLLFRYYNLLYFVERRFFPPDRTLGIYFEWYDSLTGVPSCQRTVAFEKACVLFNLGSVYTQIATRQDRYAASGLDAAVENYLRAAGVFRHILETFSNAPSMDLKPQVLQIIVALMLAQARECLFEKLVLQLESVEFEEDYHIHKDLSGEAAQLQAEYLQLHAAIRSDDNQTFMPECWAGFVPLKAEYYKALAHYHASKSLPASGEMHERRDGDKNVDAGILLTGAAAAASGGSATMVDAEVDTGQAKMAHIKESLACHDEAQRLQRMCRELKNKISLTKLLNEAYLRAVCEMEMLEQSADPHRNITFDDDLSGIDLTIPAASKFNLHLIGPDFTAYKTDDPFRALGPIAIFSARRHWSAPRNIRLQTGSVALSSPTTPPHADEKTTAGRYYVHSRGGGRFTTPPPPPQQTQKAQQQQQQIAHDSIAYGFHMRGDAPVIVSGVLAGSLADLGGIKEGDFIVELNAIDVKWSTHAQISALIAGSGTSLDLKVITPMDRNYLKVNGGGGGAANNVSVNHSSHHSSSASSSGSHRKQGSQQQQQPCHAHQHHSHQQQQHQQQQHRKLIAASAAAQQAGGSVSARSLGSSSGVSSGTSSPTGTAGKAKLRGTKSGSGKGRLSVSWNPFRRTQSLGKIF